jgi:hypothetical protein
LARAVIKTFFMRGPRREALAIFGISETAAVRFKRIWHKQMARSFPTGPNHLKISDADRLSC